MDEPKKEDQPAEQPAPAPAPAEPKPAEEPKPEEPKPAEDPKEAPSGEPHSGLIILPVPPKPQFVLERKIFIQDIVKPEKVIFGNTIGQLYIEKQEKGFILEDVVRDLGPNGEGKIKGRTAIPYGLYQIILDYSSRFQRHMPHLLDVKFFSGIRIHPGNRHVDTDGCLLPGVDKTEDNRAVTYSRKAYEDIYHVLDVMTKHEKVFIEIVKGAT